MQLWGIHRPAAHGLNLTHRGPLDVEWRFPGQSVRFLEGSEDSLFVLPRMARSDKQRTLETAPDRLDVTTQRGEHSCHLPESGRRGRERPQGRGLLSHWFARAISCTAWLSLIWAKVLPCWGARGDWNAGFPRDPMGDGLGQSLL